MPAPIMRFPGGKAKVLTLSYDDGVFDDYRLIEIMSKNGLKGTFNINAGLIGKEPATRSRLNHDQIRELYVPSGNEVAIHGYTHPRLNEMSQDQITYQIVMDRQGLEQLTGQIARGMAYPYGTTNDTVVKCLEACGVAYARTTVETGNFSIPAERMDWLRLSTTCHHNDPRLFELADQFCNTAPRAIDSAIMFYLWGHSYEFTNDNTWHIIERFAQQLGNRDDIWYATNIQIYDYIAAYKQLRWSADGKIVHNPTATTLYFNCNTTLVELSPGQTLSF